MNPNLDKLIAEKIEEFKEEFITPQDGQLRRVPDIKTGVSQASKLEVFFKQSLKDISYKSIEAERERIIKRLKELKVKQESMLKKQLKKTTPPELLRE